jgi:hypothetical protein
MVDQFGQIASQLYGASLDLQQIKGALARTLFRLDEIEVRLTGYLEVILDEPFERRMKECLGHEAATGKPLTEDAYDTCTFDIAHFVDLAKAEPVSGQWKPGMTGRDFATHTLLSGDWSGNVNLFLALAKERGGYPLPDRRANPVRWATAVDAYVRLATENTEIFRRKPSKILDELISEGVAINRDFSVTIPGSGDKYLSTLFSLVEDYNHAAQQVGQAAGQVRQRVLTERKAKAAWLSPPELAKIVADFRPELTKRDVQFAGNWPVVNTDWPPYPPGPANLREQEKNASLGDGIPFGPLSAKDYVWTLISFDNSLVAIELVGFGELALRYFPDVYQPDFVDASSDAASVWGEPIATVFAYLVKSGGATPPKKPVALQVYQDGEKTTLFLWNCSHLASAACKYLRPYVNHVPGIPEMQFDWQKFLEAQVALSPHVVVRSPIITTQVENRLDELLMAQHTALLQESQLDGSELYNSMLDLDGTVAAIRGLVALTLPGPSAYDDKVRAALYGRPGRSTCRHTKSRVEEPRPAYEPRWVDEPQNPGNLFDLFSYYFRIFNSGGPSRVENNYFSDPLKRLATIDGAGETRRDMSTTVDVQECQGDKTDFSSGFEYLISSDVMRYFLQAGLDKSGHIAAELLDQTSLLINLPSLARAGGDTLVNVVARDLPKIAISGNDNPFLWYRINKLKALKNTINNQ